MRSRIVLFAIAAMMIVPPVAAQSGSTPTTLYFHVFDTFNKFPINTQPMDVEFFEVGGTNFPTIEQNGWDFNTIYGYSTAGPVEYDFIENGRPRFHPERGIAADVELDESAGATAYMYIDVRDITGVNGFADALPTFTFDLSVRTGDDLGDTAMLDAGQEIMSGSLSAHVVDTHTQPTENVNAFWGEEIAPDPTGGGVDANDAFAGQSGPDGLPIFIPDADGIVEFAIPLTMASDKIPKSEAYNVRIDWYQAGEYAGKDEISSGFFRLAADQQHLPRIELGVKNPVYVEFIHPQVAAGTLLIHTGVNSPWGTYDVDVDNMTLTITDPAGNVVKEHRGAIDESDGGLERFVSQGAHVHNQHDQAAEVTYMWKFRDEGVKDGEYTIDLTVPNLRGNADASASAKFIVEGKKAFGESDTGEVVEPVQEAPDAKQSPGIGPVSIVALLGLAFVRRWKA